MRRSIHVQGFAATMLAGMLSAVVIGHSTARAVDVHGDDGADRFTGSGGIVLPGGGSNESRRAAAECRGCHWRMSDPCAHTTNPGEEAACLTIPGTCAAPDSQLLRGFLSRDGGANWEYLGMYCIGSAGPVQIADVGGRLRAIFERAVPPQRMSVQPPVGALPHLPVLFDSGQPASLPGSRHVVLGVEVTLRPRAHWHWEFGDGAVLDTTVPGSRYPSASVSHIYRASEVNRVHLVTTWTADFLVDDLGPFDVPEPVHQSAELGVPVGQGRAVLVP